MENMNVEGVCTALGQCDDELGVSPFLDVTIVAKNDTTDFGKLASSSRSSESRDFD